MNLRMCALLTNTVGANERGPYIYVELVRSLESDIDVPVGNRGTHREPLRFRLISRGHERSEDRLPDGNQVSDPLAVVQMLTAFRFPVMGQERLEQCTVSARIHFWDEESAADSDGRYDQKRRLMTVRGGAAAECLTLKPMQ